MDDIAINDTKEVGCYIGVVPFYWKADDLVTEVDGVEYSIKYYWSDHKRLKLQLRGEQIARAIRCP